MFLTIFFLILTVSEIDFTNILSQFRPHHLLSPSVIVLWLQ